MFAGMWYLDPGSKSSSDLSTGGLTPMYSSLSRCHSQLKLFLVVIPLKTSHRHLSIAMLKGKRTSFSIAIEKRKFISASPSSMYLFANPRVCICRGVPTLSAIASPTAS